MLTTVDFKPGDTVQVFEKIKEGDKIRTQIFEGIVTGLKGRAENRSFRVRKMSAGKIWVEKIWPVMSLNVEKVIVKERPKRKVRRAKLYKTFVSSK